MSAKSPAAVAYSLDVTPSSSTTNVSTQISPHRHRIPPYDETPILRNKPCATIRKRSTFPVSLVQMISLNILFPRLLRWDLPTPSLPLTRQKTQRACPADSPVRTILPNSSAGSTSSSPTPISKSKVQQDRHLSPFKHHAVPELSRMRLSRRPHRQGQTCPLDSGSTSRQTRQASPIQLRAPTTTILDLRSTQAPPSLSILSGVTRSVAHRTEG